MLIQCTVYLKSNEILHFLKTFQLKCFSFWPYVILKHFHFQNAFLGCYNFFNVHPWLVCWLSETPDRYFRKRKTTVQILFIMWTYWKRNSFFKNMWKRRFAGKYSFFFPFFKVILFSCFFFLLIYIFLYM